MAIRRKRSGHRRPTDGYTGSYLVVLRANANIATTMRTMASKADLKVASSSDFGIASIADLKLKSGDGLVFEELGVAVVDSPPDQLAALSIGAKNSPFRMSVPERMMYAFNARPISALDIPCDVSARRGKRTAAKAINQSKFTWGLQLTGVSKSKFTGRDIRVAVLDTGIDLQHPDFADRVINSRSFIAGDSVQDGHGHGTHCIGTACGPLAPASLPRYGIAHEAEIYAGKVLGNDGAGADRSILAGIDWALTNQCAVVSMSLGSMVQVGEPFDPVFETVGARTLQKGTLIIAAAGNDSVRPDIVAPVGRPANCPSIMAVAALDSALAIAPFSNGAVGELDVEHIDIAGPGVAIDSAWQGSVLRRTISGTSMATPHVAGIAALYAQANPEARGQALWDLLVKHARRLKIPERDIGAGLVRVV